MVGHMTDITVVMATYKQAKYLRDSIGSILNNFEKVQGRLCFVPVCGDKRTSEWMQGSLKPLDPKTKEKLYLVPSLKANIWHQRQLGLNTSKNSYVSFFDSDDVMLPGWLDRGLKVAEEISSRGKIPIVGPSYRMVDEKLRPLQDVIMPEFSMDKMMNGSIIPDFSITRTENLRIAFEAGCKVARENFAPQYSCYCTWLEMLKRFDCEVKLLPDIGFLYRQHHGGMHNRFKRSKRASRKNVEMVRKIAKHYFPEGV